MKILLILPFFITSNLLAQKLPVAYLNSVMKLNISSAQDFIEAKGYEYTGGTDDKFFKDVTVIQFKATTGSHRTIFVTYDPKQELPIMLAYSCSKEELSEMKKLCVEKGFKMTSYTSTSKAVKYFFDKLNSKFTLTFTSGYDNERKITSSIFQILKK